MTNAPNIHPVNTFTSEPVTNYLTKPLATVPQKPQAPWIVTASKGSSVLSIYIQPKLTLVDSSHFEKNIYINPDTTPMAMDHQKFAASHPAVIPTNPARIPFERLATLSTWSIHILSKNAVSPPAAAESVVFMQIT